MRKFYDQQVMQKGRTRLWHVMRPVLGRKQSQSPSLDITPDALNDYYVSVGPLTAASVPPATAPIPVRLTRVITSAFKVHPIDIHTLHATVLSMKPSSNCGLDGLSISMFKKLFVYIGFFLLDIINCSLASGIVPTSWKHALVIPIPKGRSSNEPSDTRPISLQPAVMKLLEKVVQCQLAGYLEDNHILSDAQHGYRKNFSTETALNVISDKALQAMDDGKVSILVLLDLSKMFDVVPHEKLLDKMALYGIDTTWFKHYLSGHTQQVQVKTNGNSIMSRSKSNDMGIYQGGSLSCLLAMIFMNDLSLFVDDDVTVVTYADDTQVIISGKKQELPSIISRIENAIHSLFQWFCFNGMKVNSAKTQMIVLGTPAMLRSLPNVTINFCGNIIVDSKVVKNIGVMLDRHLNFEHHVSTIQNKATGILIALNNARHVIPKRLMPAIVQGLVISIIRYCICIYGSCGTTQTHRIKKMLNFCARVVSGSG